MRRVERKQDCHENRRSDDSTEATIEGQAASHCRWQKAEGPAPRQPRHCLAHVELDPTRGRRTCDVGCENKEIRSHLSHLSRGAPLADPCGLSPVCEDRVGYQARSVAISKPIFDVGSPCSARVMNPWNIEHGTHLQHSVWAVHSHWVRSRRTVHTRCIPAAALFFVCNEGNIRWTNMLHDAGLGVTKVSIIRSIICSPCGIYGL